MRQFLLSLREILEVILISFITVYVVRSFLVQPFLVSGASMEPNFDSGNYLIIDELTYRFREPQRGEVIVFRYPGDHKTFYIKRVIGLPGERIVVARGLITIYTSAYPSGFVLQESYLTPGVDTSGDNDVTLGTDEYFVLGDNRYFSFDSRSWGKLTREAILGVVRLRLFPVTDIDTFRVPLYSYDSR